MNSQNAQCNLYCANSQIAPYSTMKIRMISINTKGSHHVLPPNQHFTLSKDEWDTKEQGHW